MKIRRLLVAGALFVAAIASGGQLLAQPVRESPKAPTCSVPNAPSRVVRFGTVLSPSSVLQHGVDIQIAVSIDLDSASRIIGRPVVIASPNKMANQAAIEAALSSSYSTRIANCVPVADSLLLLVKFTGAPKVPATFATFPAHSR
jgi:hypothetical protein